MLVELSSGLRVAALGTVVLDGYSAYRRTANDGFMLVALALVLEGPHGLGLRAVLFGDEPFSGGMHEFRTRLALLSWAFVLVVLPLLAAGLWRLGGLPRRSESPSD